MSFSRTKAVIDVMDICNPVKSVLVVIASHADENTGRCWPSIATIAGKSGLSQSTVKRALKAVRTSGLIKVHKKVMASGQAANYYLLPDEDQIRAEWPRMKGNGTEQNKTEKWNGGIGMEHPLKTILSNLALS